MRSRRMCESKKATERGGEREREREREREGERQRERETETEREEESREREREGEQREEKQESKRAGEQESLRVSTCIFWSSKARTDAFLEPRLVCSAPATFKHPSLPFLLANR